MFLTFAYLLHSFMVADGSNQSISYAANVISVRLLTPSRIRRFLIFDIDLVSKTSRFLVFDELDNAFEGAVNDDVDVNKEEFVDDREETVDGVEIDGRDTTTEEPTTLAMVCFLLFTTANDIPFFVFVWKLLSVLAMLSTDVRFVVFGRHRLGV
jgi:hypothetical protein